MSSFAILVISGDDDYEKIIHHVLEEQQQQCTFNVRVIQTTWEDLVVEPVPLSSSSSSSFPSCPCRVKALWKNGGPVQNSSSSIVGTLFYPQLLLVRNECSTAFQDAKAKLLAFAYARVPSVNSIRSILQNAERAVMMAALASAAQRLEEAEPEHKMTLIPQSFISDYDSFRWDSLFPAVVKVGNAHAGFGKAKLADKHALDDMRSIFPMLNTKDKFAFLEPFLDGAHDLRLQKLGRGREAAASYRVFQRVSLSGDWKTQTSSVARITEIAVTPRYKAWMDAAQVMFGADDAMEIVTVDVLVAKTGEEFVLEVNHTSSGLFDEADNLQVGRIVLERAIAIWEEDEAKRAKMAEAAAAVAVVPKPSGAAIFSLESIQAARDKMQK